MNRANSADSLPLTSRFKSRETQCHLGLWGHRSNFIFFFLFTHFQLSDHLSIFRIFPFFFFIFSNLSIHLLIFFISLFFIFSNLFIYLFIYLLFVNFFFRTCLLPFYFFILLNCVGRLCWRLWRLWRLWRAVGPGDKKTRVNGEETLKDDK